jgi:hypothetical protein
MLVSDTNDKLAFDSGQHVVGQCWPTISLLFLSLFLYVIEGCCE